MKLNPKQSIALDYLEDNQTTELLYGGGAGGGKSILGCYWLLKMCFKYPESRWLMGRANMKTLKETTYQSFLKVAKMQGLKADVHFLVTASQHKEYPNCILFPNKSVIMMKDLDYYPSDPEFDELGSLEITGGFIDEANQVTIKAKQIVQSRMRHNISLYGIVPKLLATCNPAKNWVYQDFYKPFRQTALPDYRKFIQALVDDNPDIDPSYKENLLKLDKNSKERLLYGNWEYDDDPAALISYEKILDCFSNSFVPTGEKYITADIARLGSDKIVICVWNGFRVEEIKSYTKERLSVTGEIIEQLRAKYQIPKSNIICDEDGVGGGIIDFMGYKGFVNNSKPFPNPDRFGVDENYNHLKSQCYFRLADRINKGQVYIKCDDSQMRSDIIQELEQVKQHNMDKDGKRQVLPKDKVKELIGRSPDYSDALMMREYFELKPSPSWVAF
jgi:phage terminase large subunit